MQENKSNRIGIIVALIIIFLILGGVYLLNQTFNQGSRTSDDTSKQTTKTETANNSSTNSNTTTSDSNLSQNQISPEDIFKGSDSDANTSTNSNTTGNQNTANSTNQETNTSVNSEKKEETQKTTDTEKTETTTETVKLESNQILATLSSVSNGRYSFVIKQCGNSNPNFCKSGTKFYLENLNPKVVNETSKDYLINATITDTKSGLSISNATVKKS